MSEADEGALTDAERDALAAADAIVDDFGSGRVREYFARFAPEATFVFHTTAERLENRAAYERLWADWVRESGFAVRSCRSSDRRIQVFGSSNAGGSTDGAFAVFTHTVDTVVVNEGAEEAVHERESIILQHRQGQWVCVHEHLSTID